MKIVLDWDDVVADTAELKAATAKRLFKVDIPPGEFTASNVVDVYLSRDQYRVLQKITARRPIGLQVKPKPGAVEHIHLLQAEGHEVSIATSRDGEYLETARELALMYGLTLSFEGVGYKKSKAPALVGKDIFVDNDEEKLEDVAGVVGHRYLFSKSPCKIPGVVRVTNWRDLYQNIRGVAAG